jgi:hypothetical protein
MFGHDDQSQRHDAADQPAQDGGLTHDDQALADAATNDTAGEYIDSDTPVTAPSVPSATDEDADVADDTTAAPVAAPVTPTVATPSVVTPAAVPDQDSLLGIKQQALQQLTPLVGHLEQSAEEKFRTTMMMIQASDNPSLIQTAYDAALQIADEKIRAQALLDIVNEINYFTHNNDSAASAEA